MTWEVKVVTVEPDKLDGMRNTQSHFILNEALRGGWEPIAVTPCVEEGFVFYHLRRWLAVAPDVSRRVS
jgi:hypothetical protein